MKKKNVVLPNESFFFFPLLLLIPLKTNTLGNLTYESFGKPFGIGGQSSGS